MSSSHEPTSGGTTTSVVPRTGWGRRGATRSAPEPCTPARSRAHRGRQQICFAGVGPGEVLLDGRKVVGISQRRTRVGARFQCVVLRTWDPSELARIFAPDEWGEVADLLEPVAVGVPDLDALEAAFLATIATR